MCYRLAQTIERNVRGFFSFFSFRKEKNTFLLCQRRKICAFLTEEKSTKRLTETLSRTLIHLLGSTYPRLPTDGERTYVRSPSMNWEAIYTLLEHSAKINRITMQCSALQGNAVRKATAAGKPAPAGARRAPCERLPARYPRKWRRLTDHASFASVDAVFHSRHRIVAGRTKDQAEGLQFF